MQHSMNLDPEVRHCLDLCRQCHDSCLGMAMTFCLREGGRHVEQEHLRTMLNCAEICQTAANFMLSGSPLHGAVCGACAVVCYACARSCADIGDMEECERICRDCAESCETMSSTTAGGHGMTSRTSGRAAGATA